MENKKQTFSQTIEIAKKFVAFFLQDKYGISDIDIEKFFDDLPISIDEKYYGHTRGYYSSQNGIFIVSSHIPENININILSVIIHEIGHAVSDRFSKPEHHRIIEEGMVNKFTTDCINYWIEHDKDLSFLEKIEIDYLKMCGFSSHSYPLPTAIAKTFSLLATPELSKKNSTPDQEYFFGNKFNFILALESVFNDDWKPIIHTLETLEYKDFNLVILKLFPYFERVFAKLPEKERNQLISNITSAIDIKSTTENSPYYRNHILHGLLLEHEFKNKEYFSNSQSITSKDIQNLPLHIRQLLFSTCSQGIYPETVLAYIQKFYQTSSLDDFLSVFTQIANIPPSIGIDILNKKIENQDSNNFVSFIGKFQLPTFLKFNEKMNLTQKYMDSAPGSSNIQLTTYINSTRPIANGIIRLFNNLEDNNFRNENHATLLRTFLSAYQLAVLTSPEPLDNHFIKALMLKITLSDRSSYGKNYLEFLKAVIISNNSNCDIIDTISTDDFGFLTKRFFDDGINFCNPTIQKSIKSNLEFLMSQASIDFVDSKRTKATYKYFANSINNGLHDIQKLHPNLIENYDECFEHLQNNDLKNFHIDFSVPKTQEEATQNVGNILNISAYTKTGLLPYLAVGLNQNMVFQTTTEEKINFYKKLLQGNESYRAKHLIKNAANFLADDLEGSSFADYKLLKDFADSIDLTDTSPSRAYRRRNDELEI